MKKAIATALTAVSLLTGCTSIAQTAPRDSATAMPPAGGAQGTMGQGMMGMGGMQGEMSAMMADMSAMMNSTVDKIKT
jgi:hypothetical protein